MVTAKSQTFQNPTIIFSINKNWLQYYANMDAKLDAESQKLGDILLTKLTKIGKKFGLTYSAVSRRVGVFKDLLRKNSGLQNKLNRVKAPIKIRIDGLNFMHKILLDCHRLKIRLLPIPREGET